MDELINNIMQSPENTNPNVLKGQLQKIASSGGGMPDASGFKDGTALVAIDGKFVPAEGYGYLGEEMTIMWDGIYRANEDAFIDVGDPNHTKVVIHKWYNGHFNQDEIIMSADVDFSREIMHVTSVFKKQDVDEGFSNIFAVYMDKDTFGERFIVYDVFSEDFWSMMANIESLGTGVFVSCKYTGDSIADGDFLFTYLGADSLIGTATIVSNQIKIDPRLLPDTVLKIKVVESLPGTGVENVIYIMPHDPSTYENRYDEYIWVAERSSFEKFGGIEVDLSDYVTSGALNSALSDYVTTQYINNQNYVTNSQLNNKDYVTNTQLNNKDYVTNTQLNNKGFITGAQVDSKLNAKIITGTTEYEDGVTDLANGVIYLQYEV